MFHVGRRIAVSQSSWLRFGLGGFGGLAAESTRSNKLWLPRRSRQGCGVIMLPGASDAILKAIDTNKDGVVSKEARCKVLCW